MRRALQRVIAPTKQVASAVRPRHMATSTTLVTPDNKLANGFKEGWFHEINAQWPGIACSLECKTVLHDEKSEYQHVQVFESTTFGNVLVLDGVIQVTDRDEFAYQEMLAHLPLFAHPNPKTVLIIGGGDGGIIREVVKHKSVEKIVICEIDKMVIDCGKKYFPNVASAWDDPRVELVCGDAVHYVEAKENEDSFDVIICDSSDPIGPAQALFEPPFYRAMHRALRAGGRVSTQAESMWVHEDLIKSLVSATALIFPEVHYATTQIPTYPCGQMGLLQLQKAGGDLIPTCSPKTPARAPPVDMPLKYYTHELHTASFVLPKFLADSLEGAKAKAIASKAS